MGREVGEENRGTQKSAPKENTHKHKHTPVYPTVAFKDPFDGIIISPNTNFKKIRATTKHTQFP